MSEHEPRHSKMPWKRLWKRSKTSNRNAHPDDLPEENQCLQQHDSVTQETFPDAEFRSREPSINSLNDPSLGPVTAYDWPNTSDASLSSLSIDEPGALSRPDVAFLHHQPYDLPWDRIDPFDQKRDSQQSDLLASDTSAQKQEEHLTGQDTSGHKSKPPSRGDSPLSSEPPEKSPALKPTKRGCLGRVKDKIYAHVDPHAVLHLFDFRPWFWPFTWKKYGVLFLIACAIAGIVVSNHYTGWIQTSLEITRSYMLPVLIISVCAEPLIILVVLPVAIVPDIPRHEIDAAMNVQTDVEAAGSEKHGALEGPFETALIIPCHDTDHDAMRTTLDSAFPRFRPQDIYIVDNGRTRYPSHPEGNFRAYIRSIHPDIVYIWSCIGSKNAAQLIGALAARNRGYKYIMSVDDDVCIPKNFSPPTEMIDDTFKAVAYPIKAMDAHCNVPLWLVAWQDVEYRLSGLAKLAEDRLCGVQFPHGAGWFVEIGTFITLMSRYHPMDFIAEDCNAGLCLNKMGKGLRFDSRSFLATEVPTTFFGPGLNWWKQRQKSWEMGRHGRFFAFVRHFLFSMPPRKTVQGILWHKITLLYLICTILIDYLRIPTIVALGRTGTWWRNAILLMLFSAFPPIIYSYWKCRRRPDMKVRFWACITYPWYKQIYVLVSIFGAIRAVGYFFGGHQAPPTIKQMLKQNDERCFWLDPQFKENPAWLADEAEAREAETEGPMTDTDTEVNEKAAMSPRISVEVTEASYSSIPHAVSGPEVSHPNSLKSNPRSRLPTPPASPASPYFFGARVSRNTSQSTLNDPFSDRAATASPLIRPVGLRLPSRNHTYYESPLGSPALPVTQSNWV